MSSHTPIEELLRVAKRVNYPQINYPQTDASIIRTPPPDGEFVASDQVYRSFSRWFTETKGRRLQPYLTELTDALKVYDISCQLTVQLDQHSEMTFSTSNTNSEANVARARKALEYLQLMPFLYTPVVIKYINGSFAEDIPIGHQEGGLCSTYRIESEQSLERKILLAGSLRDLERLTGCDIWLGANRVIIIGTFEGSRLAREVVEDCIVRNMPPAPKIRDLMTSLASQEFETLGL
ncbi:putative K domain, type 1 protein [Rosa chinensis]|uniref:Putative K domain, type 1 protein n=1 Tax=Rosa chinensis TaxID=74649 RepID=A0A2P6SE32_ROSCH|nr:uncharacterized protein LOC112182910 [Rosa chinensis]PRQ56941.1 putative K domain, type 1 protein [Rosa chinensis]